MSSDFPQRKRLHHTIPEWVDESSRFFITICCAKRSSNQLCTEQAGSLILKSTEHYHNNLTWFCDVILLMSDHIHGIFSFPKQQAMDPAIRNFKSYISRNSTVKWQRGFFDHRLRNDDPWDLKIEYILQNPVRAELAKSSIGWKWIWRPS